MFFIRFFSISGLTCFFGKIDAGITWKSPASWMTSLDCASLFRMWWRVFSGSTMSRCSPRLGDERFPSTRSTLLPCSESAAPRETTVLVFPTPPFKLTIPIVLPITLILGVFCLNICAFWMFLRVNINFYKEMCPGFGMVIVQVKGGIK